MARDSGRGGRRDLPDDARRARIVDRLRLHRRYDLMDKHEMVAWSHRLIRLRLVGWILIGIWQVLSLVSEFVRLVDLESRPWRIAAKSIGLVGLIVVAYGFERFAEVNHRISNLHE